MRFPIPAAAVLLLTAWRAMGQGAPLGPEFRLNNYTTLDQARGHVAMDAAGNFVVVWRNGAPQDGSSYGVFGKRFASTGALLGGEFQINTYTTSGQSDPDVASDSAGNFVVVWQTFGQDGPSVGIFGKRYSSLGAPLGVEFRVNTYTTNNQSSPAVASDGAGNFVVFWGSSFQDGSNYGVFGRRFSSTGAAFGADFQVNSYATGPQTIPAVALDGAGNFVVVWVSGNNQDGSGYGVFGKRYSSSGSSIGGDFQVNSYTTGLQTAPAVAFDGGGNFVVVWDSDTQDGSYYGIFGKRFSSAGVTLGGEFRVNTFTTGYQSNPVVASDSAGNFIVVWDSDIQEGSSRGVFAKRYSSTGAPFGGEFLVNSYTTSIQANPAVAATASGNFVVVWQSYGQDGSKYGVFGQRFASTAGGRYSSLTPCRIFDTRNAAGPDAAAPALLPSATRVFAMASRCGIPLQAKALSINVSVTGPTAVGYLTLYPGNSGAPLAATITFSAGQTRSNNAVVLLSSDGTQLLNVLNGAAGTVHFILDVNGYFE